MGWLALCQSCHSISYCVGGGGVTSRDGVIALYLLLSEGRCRVLLCEAGWHRVGCGLRCVLMVALAESLCLDGEQLEAAASAFGVSHTSSRHIHHIPIICCYDHHAISIVPFRLRLPSQVL